MSFQPVPGEFHAVWQRGIDVGMLAQLVADMGKPGAGYAQLLHFFYGFGQIEMGYMFLMAQCVQYDLFAAPDLFLFALFDPVGVGDIGKIPEPEAQYRHFQVPYLDGEDLDISYLKGVFFDSVEAEIRYAGILYVSEGVGKLAYDAFLCHFIGIEIHGPVLEEIVSPDIIQACNMVFMGVGKDDSIQLPDVVSEHLVPEIRCGVDDQGGGRRLDEDAGAKSFVFFIGRSAHFTRAGDHRNPGAGPGTQESDF